MTTELKEGEVAQKKGGELQGIAFVGLGVPAWQHLFCLEDLHSLTLPALVLRRSS